MGKFFFHLFSLATVCDVIQVCSGSAEFNITTTEPHKHNTKKYIVLFCSREISEWGSEQGIKQIAQWKSLLSFIILESSLCTRALSTLTLNCNCRDMRRVVVQSCYMFPLQIVKLRCDELQVGSIKLTVLTIDFLKSMESADIAIKSIFKT